MRGDGGQNKRSVAQREKDLIKIAKLHNRGYNTRNIAKRIGISQPMVVKDLKKIRKRARLKHGGDKEALIADKLSQFDEMLQEVWQAWEQSKGIAYKKVIETKEGEDGTETTKVTETHEHRLPNAEFMKLILQFQQEIIRLFGLQAAKEINLSGSVDVKAILEEVPEDDIPDIIEAKIVKVTEDKSPQLDTEAIKKLILAGEEETEGNGQVHNEEEDNGDE